MRVQQLRPENRPWPPGLTAATNTFAARPAHAAERRCRVHGRKPLRRRRRNRWAWSLRTELLDRLRASFPDMKIAALMGDREFIGDAWMAYLQRQNTGDLCPFAHRRGQEAGPFGSAATIGFVTLDWHSLCLDEARYQGRHGIEISSVARELFRD
jgi:hypothetical protein